MRSEEGTKRRLCGWGYHLREREKWRVFVLGLEGKELNLSIRILAPCLVRKREEVIHLLC
jgi:hypothetical protein